MSGLFGSTVIKGTKLTDFSNTSAEVGKPLPFGYGKFPVPGNVIWAPLPPTEHRQVKRQGKGGVKQETFTYTLPYAIAFCRGPISKFWWIKRNGKIVWSTDPAAPIEDQEYAAKWAERVNFYYGTPDQLPDAVIESHEGAGNVSAFRRTCYFTIEDEDVTDNGGAVPNYEACVVAQGILYLTTPPYPVLVEDGYSSNSDLYSVLELLFPIEGYDSDTDIISGELREQLRTYGMLPEGYDSDTDITWGQLRDLLKAYSMQPEGFEATDTDITSGNLRQLLIQYSMQPEGYDVSTNIVGGTLS